MNYWIFCVTNQKAEGEIFSPDTVLNQRLADHFWGLGLKTPNRTKLNKGDEVVFYKGIPSMTIAASATLASNSFKLSEDQKDEFGHGKVFYKPEFGVLLENVHLWDYAHDMKDLIPNLSFIENKDHWGVYFQGGVRQISIDDYRIITENLILGRSSDLRTAEDIINESEFALEGHLEEFIDKNWKHIKFGSEIVKYSTEEQDGRQFPAGPWSIDFLCIDKSNHDLVVIELKRGKTSDATVGQVLRYIGWVSENLAKNGQNTRGIIIAHEIDDAMRYAIKGLDNVRVLKYQVDFKLFPSELKI